MPTSTRALRILVAITAASAAAGLFATSASCGGGGAFQLIGTPFTQSTYTGTTAGSTGVQSGGAIDTGSTSSDPCSETNSRKFVRISMRNLSEDYVHYFLVMIAYVNGDTYPDGAVCEDDVQLYTSAGYIYVAEGVERTFGNYCIVGPALYYYHRNGQFRGAGTSGASSLASAIAPAEGSSPTYDTYFTAAGASLPVPNQILFHNPGTGEGRTLKISENNPNPCDTGGTTASYDDSCDQDAFYYVDEDDLLVGSTALGFGSGRRVPNEIQGTGCGCGISSDPWAELGNSSLDASDVRDSDALCNVFLRGGRIDFIFLRDDTDPPYPQLVWQVTDSAGSRAHEFDSRADVN